MRILLAFCVCALATSTVAQPGPVLGNEGGCERHAGRAPTTDNVTLLTADGIEGWESSCPIVSSTQGTEGQLILEVECSGEGETWRDTYMVFPSPGGSGVILFPADAPQFEKLLTPCE